MSRATCLGLQRPRIIEIRSARSVFLGREPGSVVKLSAPASERAEMVRCSQ